MKVPPRGNFWLPFPVLLKIRTLCTFFPTSRNINQHQLRLLTPVSCHELCFFDEKQSLSDRYRGSYRGDWKFPVICLSQSPPYYIFFCPIWQGQWYRCQWNLPKHLSNIEHLHPTANPGAGSPPAHWTPTSASRWAEQGCLSHSGHCWPDSFSNLSTPWCKPSQAVPMSELMILSPSISQCRHLIPTENHLNFSCFSFHLTY